MEAAEGQNGKPPLRRFRVTFSGPAWKDRRHRAMFPMCANEQDAAEWAKAQLRAWDLNGRPVTFRVAEDPDVPVKGLDDTGPEAES